MTELTHTILLWSNTGPPKSITSSYLGLRSSTITIANARLEQQRCLENERKIAEAYAAKSYIGGKDKSRTSSVRPSPKSPKSPRNVWFSESTQTVSGGNSPTVESYLNTSDPDQSIRGDPSAIDPRTVIESNSKISTSFLPDSASNTGVTSVGFGHGAALHRDSISTTTVVPKLKLTEPDSKKSSSFTDKLMHFLQVPGRNSPRKRKRAESPSESFLASSDLSSVIIDDMSDVTAEVSTSQMLSSGSGYTTDLSGRTVYMNPSGGTIYFNVNSKDKMPEREFKEHSVKHPTTYTVSQSDANQHVNEKGSRETSPSPKHSVT